MKKKPTSRKPKLTIPPMLRFFFAKLANPTDVEWTRDDRNALTNFLGTGTGKRLQALLVNNCAAMNEWAVNSGKPEGCATAVGIKASYSFILSCAATNSGTSDQSDDNNATSGSVDHLRA